MAVVETLELRFRADMGDMGAQFAALSKALDGLGKALFASAPKLGAQAAALVRSVGGALSMGAGMDAQATAAGNLLSSRFAGGVSGGASLASGAARSVAAAAKFSNASAVSAARGAGAALGQGFANGISGKYGAVMAAANRIANAAVQRIRSALRIHSPSKLSFELGGFFGEGFAEGVRASIGSVEAGAQALSSGASVALRGGGEPPAIHMDAGGLGGIVRAAVAEALGGTEITIPLHVDGVKLGEASIRGINQVTRSAGRVLLEI